MKKTAYILSAIFLLASCSPHTTVARHKRYHKNKIEGPAFPTHESVSKSCSCCK